jgi:hypothetical protein
MPIAKDGLPAAAKIEIVGWSTGFLPGASACQVAAVNLTLAETVWACLIVFIARSVVFLFSHGQDGESTASFKEN